ncbi:DUF4245 domain-containing protein [Glycomyces sp. L485]|uniref:DUF4245 family protein n=1 Tax=Glycomyces sp. L485 TaxID=2909235 RepID=UPI001F4AD633|nr:DUF4245 family protein [Glycomyces sp. L485]MCH7232006.1 DUF4245 domain-containing protein [Glycomyces sp. L485]
MSSDDVKVTAEPTSRPKQRRMRDMALSLAVLLVPLAVFYWAWNWAASDREVSVVDTSEVYMNAASLGLDAVHPELPEEWKPISSALATADDAVTLRVGWYSPDGHGFQFVQTTGPVDEVDDRLTGAGEPVSAGAMDWAAYDTDAGEAWVAESAGSSIVLLAESDGAGELPQLAGGVAAGLN